MVTDSLKEEVREPMWEWCQMARLVLMAEFPNFKILSLFHIFNLPTTDLKHSAETQDKMRVAIRELARFFDVDPMRLETQFMFVRSVAFQKKLQGNGGNAEAWRSAVEHITSAKSTSETDAVREVAMRWIAWTGQQCLYRLPALRMTRSSHYKSSF